ncbi:hypothetical protein Hypma_010637 [Hypsizygus marmoreus]|uniref:VWFA domain-containing protein n=1 Tax=Hypsizygus marmoreus TaxID=39966 RepID=A0A369JTW0_HYPMA|nr:hypothetical protein Hypma_010637 [Hypsizygus marmoreus]
MFRQSKPTSTGNLDVVFLHDATKGQQAFINGTHAKLASIASTLTATGNVAPDSLRVGLIAFRDHPPQEATFVTQVFPLTSDISSVEAKLGALVSTGGGDEPDAQSDALAAALTLEWRDDATKVAILFTDSPPHGIGEPGDEFPDGCPSKAEPLLIAKEMAKEGIILYVVASEPILSEQYERAHDFYVALANLTGGKLVPLANALTIPEVIIGCISEAVAHGALGAAGILGGSFVIGGFYEPSEQGLKNVGIWSKADKLAEARDLIQPVQGHRVVEKFRVA